MHAWRYTDKFTWLLPVHCVNHTHSSHNIEIHHDHCFCAAQPAANSARFRFTKCFICDGDSNNSYQLCIENFLRVTDILVTPLPSPKQNHCMIFSLCMSQWYDTEVLFYGVWAAKFVPSETENIWCDYGNSWQMSLFHVNMKQ